MKKIKVESQPITDRPDAEYIQGKIKLIEQGLPINISETELTILESTFRGARSFYVDILGDLDRKIKAGQENLEGHMIDESRNIADVELALRRIDEFRAKHWNQIQNAD